MEKEVEALLKERLSTCGFTFTNIQSSVKPNDVLQAAIEDVYKRQVSDIEMPVMNGYEMVKRIRETDGETPMLFSSALISPKDVVKGYEIGANNYIKKPFIPEELDRCV